MIPVIVVAPVIDECCSAKKENGEIKNVSTTRSLVRNSPVTVKTFSVETDVEQIVGEEWYSITLSHFLNDKNTIYCDFLNTFKTKTIMESWFLICFLIGLAFSLVCMIKILDNWLCIEFFIYLALCLCALINIFLEIYSVYLSFHEEPWPECCSLPNTWLHTCIIGLAFYAFLILLGRGDSLCWGFIFPAFVSTIAFSLNLIMWAIMIPTIIAFMILELIIRLFICKLDCPRIVSKKLEFKYGLFAYDPTLMASTASCTICLEDYTTKNQDLCILECGVEHVFHEHCILEWLKKQETCPVCRKLPKFKYE